MPVGLFALALGGFGIGLTEFVIMGLLPEVAADFAVSESTAGYLISGYALAVAVGGIGVTAAVSRFDRKRVLLGLLVLFIGGNLLSALSPTYEAMLGGRIIAALCHGAFFGIGAVVAADMVPPAKRAGAIAMMFAGLTIANVLGVPFGTFLGQQFGWRSAFWAITVIGVLAMIGVATLVPDDSTTRPPVVGTDGVAVSSAPQLRHELAAFRSTQVWLSIAITILGFGGMFGAFTYIAYTLTEVTGFASSTVPWLLVLFGLGLFVGNYVGGKVADRALARGLMVILAVLVVVLVFFAATAQNKAATVISLILMGGFGFAITPGVQTRIMSYAAAAPTMASGANIAAFNVGNALGAYIGGLTIAAGLGFTSPIWAGAVMTAAGLGVLIAATRLDTRVRGDAENAATAAPSMS